MQKKFLSYFLMTAAIFFVSIFGVLKTNANKSAQITLSEDNVVVLSDEITGQTVGGVIEQVRKKETRVSKIKRKVGLNNDPIYLFLNTPGGSVESGLELIEVLRGLDRPVNTISMFSASMGFQLVQNLGERLVLENGILMSHRASGQFSGSFGGQSPSQLENRFVFWNSRIKEMDEQTVKRTNGKQTLESYQKAYANELWLTGKQAVQLGYADKVISVKCDKTLQGTTTHSLRFFGVEILYDLDKCPLNTRPMNIRVKRPETEENFSNSEIENIKNKFLEEYSIKSRKVVLYY